jgi:rSAM/selenodomain-associated transferase 1
MKTGKSWREKLADSKGLPKAGEITGKMTRRWGPGTMVITAPKEVDALMNRLIVFVKAPRPGAVKTRLARTIGASAAGAAYNHLVQTLLHQLHGLTGVDVCFSPDDAASEVQHWLKEGWTSSPQGEGDLGRRLLSAFQRAFRAGAKRVAVIGSDCPSVRVEDIREAWGGLQTHDVVLGPATDGGYWLIGLRQLQPNLFRGVQWSTEDVFAETVRRVQNAGLSVRLLRELTDVDTDRDWRAFLAAQNRDGIGACTRYHRHS